jgi:hypothetical protein
MFLTAKANWGKAFSYFMKNGGGKGKAYLFTA